jgi:hypothetical protein
VIPGLAAGDYELTVQAGQFSEYRATLALAVGQIASLPVRLGVNAVREQIEVRETAQGIDPQESEKRYDLLTALRATVRMRGLASAT